MTAIAISEAANIRDGYAGKLIDALITECPPLADWLDAPIPILPQRDFVEMGLKRLSQSEVVAGWICQPMGMLLTYQEALLSTWGFTSTETHQVYGPPDSLGIEAIIDRLMYIVRISIAIDVLMAPRDHGYAWINFARADWDGRSPKDWIMEGRLLDAERKLMEQLRNER